MAVIPGRPPRRTHVAERPARREAPAFGEPGEGARSAAPGLLEEIVYIGIGALALIIIIVILLIILL